MRRNVCISLPPLTLHEVDHYCKQVACSRSDFFARAARLYGDLIKTNHAEPPPPVRPPQTTLLSRMLRRLDSLGGHATLTDLMRPYAGKTTLDERRHALQQAIAAEAITLRVERPAGKRGRPVTWVDDAGLPPVAASAPTLSERITAILQETPGQWVPVARIRKRLSRYARAEDVAEAVRGMAMESRHVGRVWLVSLPAEEVAAAATDQIT